MSAKPPWDLGQNLPWHMFTSPIEKWATQPSFVIGEYLFIACAAVALAHALSQGERRRMHVLAWVAALCAGTANDVFFMALPLVNNFWQAQATIMLTPRLPLYIPCVYICFMYFPLVSVWRLGLSPLPRAALTGLAASVFYAPYDINGAKFLWWTWHDTDSPIARRLLGVPVGSTLWIITFTATFAWLLNRVIDRDRAVSSKTFAKGLAMVAAFSTPLMMIQMTALQPLDGGVPGPRGLCAAILIYGALVLWGLRRAPKAPEAIDHRDADRLLLGAAVAYFAVHIAIMAVFDPRTHKSASLHQTYGACHVKATDIAGHTRYQYLCAQDFDEDFTFACVDRLPEEGSDWYTVCGRAHTDFRRYMLAVSALGLLGALLYSYLLASRSRSMPR